MNEMWSTVLAIIGSVGGSGIIIAFTGKWLAQIIANNLIQKSQLEYDKQLEDYKNKCEMNIHKLQSQNEKLIYISNLQFETEFKIYQDIFDKFFSFTQKTYLLYPHYDTLPANKDERLEMLKERHSKYCDAYDDFSSTVEKYAPFVPIHIYDLLNETIKLASSQSMFYQEIKQEDGNLYASGLWDVARDKYNNSEKIVKLYKDIQAEVRNHLGTLKIGTINDY